MHRPYSICLLLCCLLTGNELRAQSVSRWEATTAIRLSGSTGETLPFWLRANQSGAVPAPAPAGWLQAGVTKAYAGRDSVRRPRVDWTCAVQGNGVLLKTASGTLQPQMQLTTAFAGIRFGRLELWAGRRSQVVGLIDTLLSSGSYAVSMNALPIPQVRLGLPDYVPIRWLNDWLAIKADYAHGWFNVPYIRGSKLHAKSVYVRLGKPASPIQVQAGINHQVQWGGYAAYLKDSPLAVNGKLTSNFGDYWRSVVLSLIPRDLGNPRYTSFDAANRIGNHLGTVDVGVDVRRPFANWFIYHQHPYEDASGLSGRNIPDGLYGVRWQNGRLPAGRKPVWQWKRIVGEVLSTKSQSGPYFSQPGQSYKGADNYYNHSQYIEGWSYLGQSLGTPLIMPRYELTETARQSDLFFPDNRLIAYYVAFDALLRERITVTGKFSYSRNAGSYVSPYPMVLSQFSAALQVTAPVTPSNRHQLYVAVATDQGSLLARQTGIVLGFQTYPFKLPVKREAADRKDK